MHILLWAPFGAGTHYWGPGTSAFRLYSSNQDPSIQVSLIHASAEQEEFPEVFYEQIKLPTLKGTGLLGKIHYWASAKKWIKANFHKYDVIHGITAFEYTFRPMLEFIKLGKPVYVKITGETGGFGNNSFLSKLLGLSKSRVRQANKITGYIAISSQIKENLLSFNIDPNKIHEIPNGVNIQRFRPISSEEKVKLREELNIEEKFTFIYLGGLTFNKRVIEMVEAVIKLKRSKKRLNFQLLIVGPDRSKGLVEEKIDRLIKENDLHRIIVRIDKTLQPEKYLQAADAFILVSKSEGMSNSLLEAMACGLPALVTNISGSQDLIEEGINGKFTEGTVYDISKIFKWYLSNQDELLKLGRNSRKKIIEAYSDSIVLNKHISIFQDTSNQ